jgi:hypothetical protein
VVLSAAKTTATCKPATSRACQNVLLAWTQSVSHDTDRKHQQLASIFTWIQKQQQQQGTKIAYLTNIRYIQ